MAAPRDYGLNFNRAYSALPVMRRGPMIFEGASASNDAGIKFHLFDHAHCDNEGADDVFDECLAPNTTMPPRCVYLPISPLN
jgi:hypothetical protein